MDIYRKIHLLISNEMHISEAEEPVALLTE